MAKTLVEQYVKDPDHMRLFQQERAIYEVTELLESVMEELGVTRAELAQRLGKSKSWVTQLLDGEANKTVRTVADTFAVLGHEFCSSSRPIRIGNKTHTVPQSTTSDAYESGTANQEYPRLFKVSRRNSSPTVTETMIQSMAK